MRIWRVLRTVVVSERHRSIQKDPGDFPAGSRDSGASDFLSWKVGCRHGSRELARVFPSTAEWAHKAAFWCVRSNAPSRVFLQSFIKNSSPSTLRERYVRFRAQRYTTFRIEKPSGTGGCLGAPPPGAQHRGLSGASSPHSLSDDRNSFKSGV